MRFALLLEQSEWRAELSVQRVSAVSHHWQAAAVFRAIFRKGGDDDVATGFDAVQNGANVSLSFCCRRQKVEHGAVMPDIEAVPWQVNACDIPDQPVHGTCTRSQPLEAV
jgi:hypothetical protein